MTNLDAFKTALSALRVQFGFSSATFDYFIGVYSTSAAREEVLEACRTSRGGEHGGALLAEWARLALNRSDDVLSFLKEHGVEFVSPANPNAIRLPNGDTAFVTEPTWGKLVLRHPPKGGRAQSSYQRFASRGNLLLAIRDARF